jgi:hypothetical protein
MFDAPNTPTDRPSAELSHAAIGQWGAVIAGVLGGFAASIVLATLGTALGLTAGTHTAMNGADADDATTLGGAGSRGCSSAP